MIYLILIIMPVLLTESDTFYASIFANVCYSLVISNGLLILQTYMRICYFICLQSISYIVLWSK